MSILLDALKKSEAQRQLGTTPTIHTAVGAPDTNRKKEPQWIAYPLLALSAVAIAWFSWQQFREPVGLLNEAGVDDLGKPQVAVSTAAAEEPEKRGQDRARPATLWDAKLIAAGQTAKSGKISGEAKGRREKLSRSFSEYKAEKDTATDKEPELPPKTVAKSSSDPAPPLPVAEKEQLAAQARSPSRLQPHEPEPISFWQIPQALRDSLPEFRINVLVYADQAEDRFLLINGQRLVEKEELIDGVILDEIRRDGAVFRYRNYRFLVKG